MKRCWLRCVTVFLLALCLDASLVYAESLKQYGLLPFEEYHLQEMTSPFGLPELAAPVVEDVPEVEEGSSQEEVRVVSESMALPVGYPSLLYRGSVLVGGVRKAFLEDASSGEVFYLMEHEQEEFVRLVSVDEYAVSVEIAGRLQKIERVDYN